MIVKHSKEVPEIVSELNKVTGYQATEIRQKQIEIYSDLMGLVRCYSNDEVVKTECISKYYIQKEYESISNRVNGVKTDPNQTPAIDYYCKVFDINIPYKNIKTTLVKTSAGYATSQQVIDFAEKYVYNKIDQGLNSFDPEHYSYNPYTGKVVANYYNLGVKPFATELTDTEKKLTVKQLKAYGDEFISLNYAKCTVCDAYYSIYEGCYDSLTMDCHVPAMPENVSLEEWRDASQENFVDNYTGDYDDLQDPINFVDSEDYEESINWDAIDKKLQENKNNKRFYN